MRKTIYRYSMLGIPCGLAGFLVDINWVRYFLFLLGAILCGLGRVIGTEIQAPRTLEKNGVNPIFVFEESPVSTRKRNSYERVVYGAAILGLVTGLFNFALDPGWVRNVLLVVLGASCCLIWFLDRNEK